MPSALSGEMGFSSVWFTLMGFGKQTAQKLLERRKRILLNLNPKPSFCCWDWGLSGKGARFYV